MITARGKGALEDHFDRAWELDSALAEKGDDDRLAAVRAPSDLAVLHYRRQQHPQGLGPAVNCARGHVGNEPFAVLLGDDLIDARDPLLTDMVAIQEELGGSVVALIEVEPSPISLYGCAVAEPASATSTDVDVVKGSGLVENPAVAEAPSHFAIIGRYVLHPAVFHLP